MSALVLVPDGSEPRGISEIETRPYQLFVMALGRKNAAMALKQCEGWFDWSIHRENDRSSTPLTGAWKWNFGQVLDTTTQGAAMYYACAALAMEFSQYILAWVGFGRAREEIARVERASSTVRARGSNRLDRRGFRLSESRCEVDATIAKLRAQVASLAFLSLDDREMLWKTAKWVRETESRLRERFSDETLQADLIAARGYVGTVLASENGNSKGLADAKAWESNPKIRQLRSRIEMSGTTCEDPIEPEVEAAFCPHVAFWNKRQLDDVAELRDYEKSKMFS